MSVRKLLQEIERTMKKVEEGVNDFEETWDKVVEAENQNLKEKYEADLKKSIKRLQRYRDQIKSWVGNNDVKRKQPLLDARKLIETKMEKFKVLEKETKTKAYSKEGLSKSMKRRKKKNPRADPKYETKKWMHEVIETLQEQAETYEERADELKSGSKRKQRENADEIENLMHRVERHQWHVEQLEETEQRLNDDELTIQQVGMIREDVEYYVDSHNEPDFYDDEFLYEQLDELPPEGAVESSPQEESEDEEVRKEAERRRKEAEKKAQLEAEAAARAAAKLKEKELEEKRKLEAAAARKAAAVAQQAKKQAEAQERERQRALARQRKVKQQGGTLASIVAAKDADANGDEVPNGDAAAPQQAQPQAQAQAQAQHTTPPTAQAQAPQQPPQQAQLPTAAAVVSAAAAPSPRKSPAQQPQPAQKSPVVQAHAPPQQQAQPQQQQQQQPQQHIPPPQQQQQVPPPQQPPQQPPGNPQQMMGRLPQQAQELIHQFVDGPGAAASSGMAHGAAPSSAYHRHLGMLKTSLRNMPVPMDTERPKAYHPRNPHATPACFPTQPAAILDDPATFEKFDQDTLFFIFFFQQGTAHQYLAARELKKQNWRYHKSFLTWFQRHEDPTVTTDEYEQGTYVVFDYETGWGTRIHKNFTFHYAHLEDELQVTYY